MKNIFLIGYSGCGKTTLAKAMTGFRHVMASEWIRSRAPHGATVQQLTDLSTESLARNPFSAAEFIRHKYDVDDGGYIIDGIRNPGDFATLFDPTEDLVVAVVRERICAKTSFERQGVDVIMRHVAWLIRNGVMRPSGYIMIDVDETTGFASGKNVSDIVEAVAVRATDSHGLSKEGRGHVHVEVPPIDGYVRGNIVLGHQASNEFLPATAFAVSSYVGFAPTWKVQMSTGAIFDFVPPDAFTGTASPSTLSLSDLAPFNCPASHICANRFGHLRDKRIKVWLKSGEVRWGSYLFTVDWYTDNMNANAIAIDGGEIAFVSNHKMLAGEDAGELPKYRKMVGEWKV